MTKQNPYYLDQRWTPKRLISPSGRTVGDLGRVEVHHRCCIFKFFVCSPVFDERDITIYRSECWIFIDLVFLCRNSQLSQSYSTHRNPAKKVYPALGMTEMNTKINSQSLLQYVRRPGKGWVMASVLYLPGLCVQSYVRRARYYYLPVRVLDLNWFGVFNRQLPTVKVIRQSL